MIERVSEEALAAVDHVASRAQRDQEQAVTRLEALGVTPAQATETVDEIVNTARLTLNFHPDRRDSMGRTVASGLLADGRYRSQFETGISNGGRTAVPGGDRTGWESELFGGVYDRADRAGGVLRPAYGALDLFRDPFGGSPRFGSSFLVLHSNCAERTTFCVGDSHLGPRDVGTIAQLLPVLAGAMESCLSGEGFGRGLSPDGLLAAIGSTQSADRSSRELDRYIEAQVHGPVDLATDVTALHLDPSFAGTGIHHELQEVAQRYEIDLLWSEGSEVAPAAIEPTFRGPEIVTLAQQTVGEHGLVDAASIGRALAELPYTAPPPGGDAQRSPLQLYKKLWHCCLAFGTPPSPT